VSEFSLITFKPVTPADQAVYANLETLEVHLRDLRQEIEEMIASIETPAPNFARGVLAGAGITVTNNGNGTVTISPGAGAVTGSATAGMVTYWSGTSTLTGVANFTFVDGASGGLGGLTVKNGNNTANSDVAIVAKTGGATARYAIFSMSNGSAGYGWGFDGSRFMFASSTGPTGSDFGAGVKLMTFDWALYRIGMGYGAVSPQYDVDMYNTFGNVPMRVAIRSPSGTGAQLHILGTDPSTILTSGINVWACGIDSSAGSNFKIASAGTLGGATTDLFYLTSIGTLILGNNSAGALAGVQFEVNAKYSLNADVVNRFVNAGIGGANEHCAVYIDSISGSTSLQLRNGNAKWNHFNDRSDSSWRLKFHNTASTAANIGTDYLVMSSTGALTHMGAGIVTLLNATDASAVGTAACVVAGGLGVAKKFYLGDDLYLASGKVYRVNGAQVLTAQQTGVGADLSSSTASGAYGATEQTMLQDAHDRIRTVMAALKTHGMIAT
jgi:hypothetical protein